MTTSKNHFLKETLHNQSNKKRILAHKNFHFGSSRREINITTSVKVKHCAQCRGELEFHCHTCKLDLCAFCKERHLIQLDSKHHDVTIYSLKKRYFKKIESCEKHPSMPFQTWCHSCEFPICVKCEGHEEHDFLEITSVFKFYRHSHKDRIANIRSVILLHRLSILNDIKSDFSTCQIKIAMFQKNMASKGQALKDRVDVSLQHLDKLKLYLKFVVEQQRKIENIENYELKFEKLANKPAQFLSFLKKTPVLKIKDTALQRRRKCINRQICILQDKKHNDERSEKTHERFFFRKNTPVTTMKDLSETSTTTVFHPRFKFDKQNFIKFLGEIQITEGGKRRIKPEHLFEWKYPAQSNGFVSVATVRRGYHLSCSTTDLVAVSDGVGLFLTNLKGHTLYHLTNIQMSSGGIHTMNSANDLIFIDNELNIIKLSSYTKTKITLIEKPNPWEPMCVFCSSTEDLMLGMGIHDVDKDHYSEVKIIRYNSKGRLVQTIQHNSAGQELYSKPRYITENRNGDVIVSDNNRAVVVTDRRGRHRFSYTGPPSGPRLYPYGVCTDALSHILVCDGTTYSVQMIDEGGHFLARLLTKRDGVYNPHSLVYDLKNQLLLVGSSTNDKVNVYKYIKLQSYFTCDDK
ncbi:uncharacterized protein LOC134249619 [Saccostrea cucullata]|uniref:uncharacterized protein LOC134249619 n=1 Tax=Saccostrea cuccullata TaxID=36930 RepID=UPI002ED6883E